MLTVMNDCTVLIPFNRKSLPKTIKIKATKKRLSFLTIGLQADLMPVWRIFGLIKTGSFLRPVDLKRDTFKCEVPRLNTEEPRAADCRLFYPFYIFRKESLTSSTKNVRTLRTS